MPHDSPDSGNSAVTTTSASSRKDQGYDCAGPLSRLRGGPSILIPVLIPAFTLYTTACSSAGSGSDTLVVTRDSAGIVIVENAAPVWGDTDGWRLGAEPELAIGVAAGDDAYLLFQVASALRLPDGRVVVANGSTKEIRFYDSTGNHLSSVGGMGSGPGEFRDIGLFTAYRSDSLLVFDRAQQRVTVLDRYGELGRVTRLGAKSGTFPSLRAALADGRLLARSTEVTRTGQPWRLWRDTIVITRYGPDGTDSGPLVRLPGMDRYTVDFDGNISVNNHPMGRIPEIATDGSAVYYLDGGELTVDVYSDDGLLIRSIRARYGRKPVTGEVIEETKAAWLGDSPTPDDRRTVERIFAQMEAPDLLPAAAGLLVSANGHLWVGEYSLFGVPPLSWQVFDVGGKWLGSVPVPSTFRLMQVGTDFILGVSRDEFDVERVLLFRLIRRSVE